MVSKPYEDNVDVYHLLQKALLKGMVILLLQGPLKVRILSEILTYEKRNTFVRAGNSLRIALRSGRIHQ